LTALEPGKLHKRQGRGQPLSRNTGSRTAKSTNPSPATAHVDFPSRERQPIPISTRRCTKRSHEPALNGSGQGRPVATERLEARGGRMINAASTGGLRGLQRVAAYSASKHGLEKRVLLIVCCMLRAAPPHEHSPQIRDSRCDRVRPPWSY
jgi:hypothetical protein